MFTDGIIPIDVSGAEPWVNSFEEDVEVVYHVESGGRRTKVGIVAEHDVDGAPIVRKERCTAPTQMPPTTMHRCRLGRRASARCPARNRETCTYAANGTHGGGGTKGRDDGDDPPADAAPPTRPPKSSVLRNRPTSHEQDPTYGLPAVMTVEETAEFLRLNPKTVHAAINDGEIPARKVRKRTLVFREALLKWLASDTRALPSRRRR